MKPSYRQFVSLSVFLGSSLFEASLYAEEAPAAATLPEVKVSGDKEVEKESYKDDKLSSPRMPASRLDTPQSVSIVPETLLKDQGVTTLRDALKDVSGLSIAAGEGGNQGDNLTLRGFSARSDLYLDGMRDFGSYFRDPFALERIEVLKGPSSSSFGRGSTGGLVNQVTKQASLKQEASGTLVVGSDLTRRATADVGTPIGETSAFRLNLMSHQNSVAKRDDVENRRFGLAPSFAFGLGTPTRYFLNYLHQAENNIPDYGIPFWLGRRAPVDRENFYGFKNYNFFRTNVDVLTFRIEHDFGNGLTLRNQLRYANYERSFQLTQAQIPSTATPATPLETIQVNRNQIAGESHESNVTNDLALIAEFHTGGVKHNTISGVEAAKETAAPRRFAWTGVPTTSLLDPNPDDLFTGTATPSSHATAKAHTLSIYANDLMTLTESWLFTVGLRWDQVKGDYRQRVGTIADLSNKDQMTSYRGGVTYKPGIDSSIYLNYGTSFNPSIENLSLAANTEELDPEESETYELGYKSDFFSKAFTLEASVFRLDKKKARTPDPTDPTRNVLSGHNRVDGAEIGAVGKLGEKWNLSAGYTYLFGKIVDTNRVGEKGAPLNNTPKHSATAWAAYQATERFSLGGGAYGVSSRVASPTPDALSGRLREVPGYVLVSAMAKYGFTPEFDLQFNINNVGDVVYYDGIHPGHINVGAGRTFLVTSQFRL